MSRCIEELHSKVFTDESALPYCQVPTPRNVGIEECGTAWIAIFSTMSRGPYCE
jgi:hypothetical protein